MFVATIETLSLPDKQGERMGRGRGTSAGGGKSSLGYLFGGGEAAAPQPPPNEPTTNPAVEEPATEPASKNPNVDKNEQTPPATTYATNNYYRTDGQNCGNFITVCSVPCNRYKQCCTITSFTLTRCLQSNRIGHQRRSMLHPAAAPPWITCLVMARSDPSPPQTTACMLIWLALFRVLLLTQHM